MSAQPPSGLRQKAAFLACGAFGFALYYAVSLLLVRATAMQPEVAAFCAVLVAVPPTFLLQKHVAFRHRGGTLPSFAKYCALQAFNSVAIAALARLGRHHGLPDAVNLAVSAVVVVVLSYLVLSRAVFRAPPRDSAPKRAINAQYNLARGGSITDRVSKYMRRRMYARFIAAGVADDDAILDVGVTSDRDQLASNYLEAWHPRKDRITACGIDDAAFLEQQYPGLRFVRGDGRDLPFPDRDFDWVHASAVLEHVGSAQDQALFLAELYRVCRTGIFVTTPNRWFPVEFHTVLPLLHWLPKRWFRALLRRMDHRELAREENLNLLGRRDLGAACVQAGLVDWTIDSVALGGWPSNLLLVARRR